jgi:hypothetical protein
MPGPSTIELPNDFWIQKEFYEPYILEKIDQALEWMNFLPRTFADSESITGNKDTYTADNDPRKRMPPLRGAGSKFVKIGISELEEVSAIMADRGFEFSISERTLRYQYNIDEGTRTLNRAARWLASFINTQVISSMVDANEGVTRSAATQKFYDRTVVAWSDEGSNPIEDMLLMTDDMENLGIGYSPTDWFVYKTNFSELRNRLITLDVDLPQKERIFGVPEAKADTIFIPALGGTVHKVNYGLIEGDILAIDRGMSPGTYYYGTNPRYAPAIEATNEDGKLIKNDYGLHSHKFFRDESHEDVVQLWVENAIMIKDPTAGLFCPVGSTKGI